MHPWGVRAPRPLPRAPAAPGPCARRAPLMELGWACSCSIWLLFLGSLAAKVLRSDLLLTPLLLLQVGLVALLQAFSRSILPPPLSAALTGVACWLVSARTAPRKRMPALGKAVLVTGCDSGFGKAVAHHLDQLGLTVFATVLDLGGFGAEELRQTCSPRLTLLEMDLTKAEDIQRALKLIKRQTVATGLWGLVNNAGFNDIIADAELTPLLHFRTCMEVNFFGTLELTKGLLPLLRSSRGRIVTISSPAGNMPYPCLASYGASKAALGLLMDTFQAELAPWGIRVSVIFPGYFKTGSTCSPDYWQEKKERLLAALPADLLADYGEEYLEEINKQFVGFMKMAVADLSSVVESITDGLLSTRPLLKYYPGRGLWLMYFIHHYLPHTVRDHFLKAFFINPGLPRSLCPRACHPAQ